MSEWWRRTSEGRPQIEEAGEVAPSGRVSGEGKPVAPVVASPEARLEALRLRLAQVEASLGDMNLTDGNGQRLSGGEWNRRRLRLKAEKERVLSEYRALKGALKAEKSAPVAKTVTVEDKQERSAKFMRSLTLIAAMRASLNSLDDPTAEERELVIAAGQWLRDVGAMP